MKVCKNCNEPKLDSDFAVAKRWKDSDGNVIKEDLRPSCKKCYVSYKKQWHQDQLKKNPNHYFEFNLKAEWGLVPEDYYRMLKEQNDKCLICGIDEDTYKKTSVHQQRFVIDHCHLTDTLRGLLCSKCNQGIGLLNDSSEVTRKASIYLHNHCMKLTYTPDLVVKLTPKAIKRSKKRKESKDLKNSKIKSLKDVSNV